MDPTTGAHMQTIERGWGLCKSMMRKQRTVDSRLFDTYLQEYVWRKQFDTLGSNAFWNILQHSATHLRTISMHLTTSSSFILTHCTFLHHHHHSAPYFYSHTPYFFMHSLSYLICACVVNWCEVTLGHVGEKELAPRRSSPRCEPLTPR